ncbi:MAG: hypothetical protein U0168_31170 [Nannocystaceae bacterium]
MYISDRVPDVDVSQIETPCFVIDRRALASNLAILGDVQRRAGCKILLALKGFAAWPLFDDIRAVLPGVTSSSPHEARLGRQHFGGEVHACAPAYSDADFDELLGLCDHVVFNSLSQWQRLRPRYQRHLAQGGRPVEFGLRINPEHREVDVELYDPYGAMLAPGGHARSSAELLPGLSNTASTTLCELGSDALVRTIAAVERGFGEFIGPRLSVG